MYISFREDDFADKNRWLSFLDKMNIPYSVHPETDTVVIETDKINVSYFTPTGFSTVNVNPNEVPDRC